MAKRVLFGDTIQNVIDYNGWTISLVNGPLVNEIAINEKDRNDNWHVLYKVKNTPAHKLHAVAMAKEEIDRRNASMSHADFSTLVDIGAPYEDNYPKWYPDDSHEGFQQWNERGYEEEEEAYGDE